MNQLHTRFYPNRIRQYSTSAGAVLRSVPPRAYTPAPTGRSSGFIYVLLALVGLFAASPSYRAQAQSLQVQKSVDRATANPDDILTYTIQYNCVSITNPCTNVVIKDVIPNLYQVTLQPATNAVYDANLQQATFNLGTLPAGTTGQVKIVGKVSPSIPGGTVLPNSATITSGGSTTVSNTVSTTVNTQIALDILKTALGIPQLGANKLMQDQEAYYTLSFRSAGNVAKTNFCVVDTLPMPDKLKVTKIETGTYANYTGTANIEYQTNLNTVWTPLTGSPFAATVSTVVPITLGAGEYVTMVRWCYSSPLAPGASTANLPRIFFDVAADAPLGLFQNCMRATSDQINKSSCVNISISPHKDGAFIAFDKVLEGATTRAVGDTVTYRITVVNSNTPSQPLTNPIIADVFKNTELDYLSWTYASTYGATTPTFSTTTNGTNTFLKWQLNESMPTGKNLTIFLKVIVKNSTAQTQKGNQGYVIADNIGGCPNRENVDTYDIDGDGNTTEMTCAQTVPITLQSLAKLTSEKLVKGQLDAGYSKFPDFGLTVPGGLADYRLRVSNQGNVPMTSVQVVDILPFIGDKGVLDTQNRLTQWRPNLAGPVTPPTGVTVYYSTENNPCRPELGYSPAGCTTANWSTAPPADITKVQSLKFDFGSIVLQPGDSLLLTWPMRAPTNAPTAGEIAWNSFGYVGVRTDNNQPLLPAEPIKVGIKVQPLTPGVYGDFVWLDTNKDGIQDPGELGISGVKVELYKDNGDGVANKTTDTFVAFTVTDGSGNYLFPNLAPGDYFAVFYPPSGYAVSPSLVGSDKTKDSEGIIAAVTSLSATEIDLTWDLGLYPSTTCDVKVANTTVSPCSYSGGVSRATVNVFVTWANPPAGQNITVTLAGASPQTINVTGGATSPALVSFTVAANGAAHAITAGFSPACQDAASILAPQPCAPAVCALGISNVLPGACTGTRREVNATLSWSNGPVGEDIVVTWDGVAVDTIQVTNGLTSPQPTRFYVPGGTGTHTLEAHFSSNTACSDSVSSLTVAACVLPCEVSGVIATPGTCNSATNQYTVTGTINLMNTTGGVATITDGAKSTTVSVPASAASVAYSLSGLTSGTGTHIVTVSLPGCGTAMATYTAPGSCTVAPPIPLLSKLVSTRRAELGSIVSYTLALANTSSIASATTTVTDSFGTGLTAIPGTTTASVGTVTSTASGFSWVVPSLPASTTATLVFSASLTQQGIVYNTATTPDGQTATTCTTVPVHICAGVPFEFELSVPTSFTSYQWSRNGQPIVGATSATLSVTAAGIYTMSGTNVGGCIDGSCCPFELVEDAPPSLSAVGMAATCTGATSNSNAAIQLTGSNSDAVSYNISVGSSYSATTALYASPRSLSSVVGGILATQSSNPELQSGGTYTIRVYSGSGCYSDVMVLIPAANCACPPVKCAPYIVKRTKVGGKPVRP